MGNLPQKSHTKVKKGELLLPYAFFLIFKDFKYSFCSALILQLSTDFWIALLWVHVSSFLFSMKGRTASYCFANAVPYLVCFL